MDAYKISIKLFAASDGFGLTEFVPVFHRWIQTHALADHLLIDVADYAHVHDGPGTVLVTSEANLYTDRGDGRLGLLYTRKLPLDGSFFDRLRKVTAAAARAAELLENEPSLNGRLKFRTDELLIRLNDRLFAPNTPETFAKIKGDLQTLSNAIYGNVPSRIEHNAAPAKLFEVSVKADKSPSLKAVINSLSAV